MKTFWIAASICLLGLMPASADLPAGEGSQLADHGHDMMEMPAKPDVKTYSLADGGLEGVNEALSAEHGIKVEGVRLTADGIMLDYRYHIEDPDLALSLHGEHERPSILHQRTGLIFPVPFISKIGSLKQSTKAPKAGRTYVILFSNPGRVVQPGDLVTIQQGPIRVADIPVE